MKKKIIVSLLAGLMASNVNFNVFSEGEYFNQNLPVMSITSAKDLNASTKKLLDK